MISLRDLFCSSTFTNIYINMYINSWSTFNRTPLSLDFQSEMTPAQLGYGVCFLFHFYVAFVNGGCHNGVTRRLLDNQFLSLKKSVNMMTEANNCYSNIPAAFYAQMKSTKTFSRGSIIVFDEVVTNQGNVYNSATGKFTAPTKGVYLFTWSALSNPGKMSHPYLDVNGKTMGLTAQNNSRGRDYINASNTAVVVLKKGDIVCIRDSNTGEYKGQYSSFNGVLLG